MNAPILMASHVVFGLMGILAALVVLVDLQNLSSNNVRRIKLLSWVVAAGIILSYILGGFWYVTHYAVDKEIIKAGSWPWAHNLVMEIKEHTFFMILILSGFLPLLLSQLRSSDDFKYLSLAKSSSALIVILGLMMEASGAVIALGVRMGL